jgi:hypothetical protein
VHVKAGLDDMDKSKFFPPTRLELRPLVIQHVASRYTDHAMPACSKLREWISFMNLASSGHLKIKVKANPITDRGGPWGCERSRLTHFLDNRLTDGSEVVSLTCLPSFIPHEDS